MPDSQVCEYDFFLMVLRSNTKPIWMATTCTTCYPVYETIQFPMRIKQREKGKQENITPTFFCFEMNKKHLPHEKGTCFYFQKP
jgi:hypothetical protein